MNKAEAKPLALQLPKPWVCLAVFVSLFLLTLSLQIRNGAFSNDFGAHSDEASHVVTGLMVRDYIAGPLWRLEHPMRFAEEYYQHFPKVALGHYPPGFYALEGIWLLPSRSNTAIILLMTALTSTCAFIIWYVGRHFLLPTNAFLAAASFILIPLVQTYTTIVMSDLLLVVFCLLATLSFGRFMETGKIRWSVLFGLLAAAAILTKGSGLVLALVPPFAILATRQFKLITNWRLWLAPIPVFVLALPWMLATRHITDEGMQHVPLSENIPAAVDYYIRAIPQTFGWILTLLLLLSFLLPIFYRKTTAPSLPGVRYALFCAFLLSLILFYIIIPSGFDTRYLLPAIPFTILLSFHALESITTTITSSTSRNSHSSKPSIAACAPLLAIVATSAFLILENGMPSKKKFTGSHQSLEAIIQARNEAVSPENRLRDIVLVSSDARGEGALIAEGCLSWPHDFSFRRSSKVLSQSDWLGRDYKSTFETSSQLKEYLIGEIDYAIVDTGVSKNNQLPHHGLLQSTLIETTPKEFARLNSIDSARKSTDSAKFIIYQIKTDSPQ